MTEYINDQNKLTTACAVWRVSGLLELFIFIYIRKLFLKKKNTTNKLDRHKSQKENLAKAKQKKVN